MHFFEAAISKISHCFERVIILFIQFSVGALILDLNIAVLFRYVLKSPIVGTQEIALVLLAWITFLGASLSVKNHSMVAVTFFFDKFGKFKRYVQILIQLLIFAFSASFFFYSYLWITSPSVLQIKLPALQIQAWITYSIVPLSMLITMIFNVDNILKLITTRRHNTEEQDLNRITKNQEAEML
ncbi:TRAP transporter small permease [Ammoniphilus sp. CFH 90114]|uniref:TRAP transporter small permease n=1 Tax=Ammoniphilus sp. CFH 90114 TaxID=2493665 RepID=UPI00100FBD87|nr:TRAP transporter small permease [Ammoniphilus sp. CFH 90114]RXT07001.1 TRAP transporter small permease [Ammoniphilus sp. CFH 90114]